MRASSVQQTRNGYSVSSLDQVGTFSRTIEDAAINKLTKIQSAPTEVEDLEVEAADDFDKIYKGEISKSGAAILPSKRIRKIPEKIATAVKAEEESGEKDKESEEEIKNDTPQEEKKPE